MNKKGSWNNIELLIVVIVFIGLTTVIVVRGIQIEKLTKDNDVLWDSLSESKGELAYCQNLMDKILKEEQINLDGFEIKTLVLGNGYKEGFDIMDGDLYFESQPFCSKFIGLNLYEDRDRINGWSTLEIDRYGNKLEITNVNSGRDIEIEFICGKEKETQIFELKEEPYWIKFITDRESYYDLDEIKCGIFTGCLDGYSVIPRGFSCYECVKKIDLDKFSEEWQIKDLDELKQTEEEYSCNWEYKKRDGTLIHIDNIPCNEETLYREWKEYRKRDLIEKRLDNLKIELYKSSVKELNPSKEIKLNIEIPKTKFYTNSITCPKNYQKIPIRNSEGQIYRYQCVDIPRSNLSKDYSSYGG